MIIFFESWSKHLIEKYPEATPNFRALKTNGLYFPNFYSSGTRSLIGISSMLLSIPHIPTLPYLNAGLETQNFSRMAGYFNRMGYKTIFIQTDEKTADKMGEVAAYANFTEFYSKEDIPLENKYPAFPKGFDKEGFQFLYNRLNAIQGSFMSIFYTSSTHTPYDAVLSEEHKLFSGATDVERYLNRLSYADAALGDFFRKAAERPWFKDTVFILLSDHNPIFSDSGRVTAADKFGSFLLIYAPSMLKAGEKRDISTQEDILPTLLDMAGVKESYSSSGSSLCDADRKNIKFIYGEDGKAYIISESGEKIVDIASLHAAGENKENTPELIALARLEAFYHAIKNDKWMKKKL